MPPSEPTTEPKNNPEVKAGNTPNPEPLPEWDLALEEWKAWWEIHNYGFGCIFAILALFSMFCLFRLRTVAKTMTLGRYFTSVCSLLLVFTLTRALYLLLDPYEAHKVLTLPVIFLRVLFALGYPCLTSVFSLINFAFIEVNNMWLITERLQNMKFLASVITAHFLVVLVVYIVVTFTLLNKLFILCQTVLIIWWLVLAVVFIYSAWKVKWQKNFRNKLFSTKPTEEEEGPKIGNGEVEAKHASNITVDNQYEDINRKGTDRIARISSLVAAAGVVSTALELYLLFEVYKLYDLPDGHVKAWPWWGYQTASRLVEVFLSCIVAYVVYPTIRTRKEKSDFSVTYQSNPYLTANNSRAEIKDFKVNLKELEAEMSV